MMAAGANNDFIIAARTDGLRENKSYMDKKTSAPVDFDQNAMNSRWARDRFFGARVLFLLFYASKKAC